MPIYIGGSHGSHSVNTSNHLAANSCHILSGDDPTCHSSATSSNTATVNTPVSMRTHHTLQTALSPESSILYGFSRPASVQAEPGLELQQHNSAVEPVFDGGNNIYDDPMFDYQEQCAAEGESDYNESHEILNIKNKNIIVLVSATKLNSYCWLYINHSSYH